MRVAMIAPPWLSIPPEGYGGIEAMLAGLVDGLIKLGVEVEVFGAGTLDLDGCKTHRLYESEQYSRLYEPMFEAPLLIDIAHLQFTLKAIADDGEFDIIHDHNGYAGPFVLDWATKLKSMPPSVHTYHGPPFPSDNQPERELENSVRIWEQFQEHSRSYIVGISEALVRNAPAGMKNKLLGSVHNAVDVNNYKFDTHKKDFFITMARFSPEKGQHIAVKHCLDLGYKLKMAGTCAGIGSQEELLLEFSNPDSQFRRNPDFRYYSDYILPSTVRNKSIKYIGNVGGKKKRNLLADAKALLFPIQWEEPFGMAVIEALASGTPVVSMNRGAMPEIIEHGVNGFLANTDEEFKEYMQRVNQIDPHECRASVERKFSIATMAQAYLDRYEEILKLDIEI